MWWVLGGVISIVLVACVGISLYVARSLGPSPSAMISQIDRLVLPDTITKVGTDVEGNRLCLDECLRITRGYLATISKVDTYQAFVTAFQRAGFTCVDTCTIVGSTWQLTKNVRVTLLILDSAEAADQFYLTAPFAPAQTTFAQLALRATT